ncbi:mycofactocin oligosaccharide methyltransferase MftM [Actinokineospora sp.]|uniref:mycofactocin oligosaccharide methyltransferase MftM n=1 Tax=Actinokineospora sp. TaxID=1872133 RepID=UPI0040378829
MTESSLSAPEIDPLKAGQPGRYEDHLVCVLRDDPAAERSPPVVVRTAHFCLRRNGARVLLSHALAPDRLDNDLAGLLAAELFDPGWLSGSDVFERVFTGIVRSTVDGAVEAWLTFYRNTLRRIAEDREGDHEHSTIAGFAPVYRRAIELTPPGHVLDLGSCFGFLGLLLAARPRTTVTASDVSTGGMRLLRTVSARLGTPVSTVVCDAARIPLPDKAVDTVTVLHLLEHLEPGHGQAVLHESVRLARRRVVVAVPYEEVPTATYGHVRTFAPIDLVDLGRRSGCRFTVTTHHGGWLVLRPA